MGIFDFLKGPDFNEVLNEYKSEGMAVLLDVRTREEYAEGHVPGSVNLPLQDIDKIKRVQADKKSAIYVYCLSGARSRQAKKFLERSGYLNVKDLGGFVNYKGKVER